MTKASSSKIWAQITCFKCCIDSISGRLWQNLLLLWGEDVERGGWGCHLTPQTHSPPQPPSFPSSSFSSWRWAFVGRRNTTSSTNCECQISDDIRKHFLNPEQKVLRYSGFPLKQNMHTSRPPCVRKCLQRPEECFRYYSSFWNRGVISQQNGHWWNIFQHGYDNYMQHAWPLDELNPLACCGRGECPLIPHYFSFTSSNCQFSGPDTENPDNININDVLGDFSLTLIDSLDTLAGNACQCKMVFFILGVAQCNCTQWSFLVMGNASEFRRAVRLVVDTVHFDKSNTVQVCLFLPTTVFKLWAFQGFWSKHKAAWESSLCPPSDGGSQFSRDCTWLVPGGLTQVWHNERCWKCGCK